MAQSDSSQDSQNTGFSLPTWLTVIILIIAFIAGGTTLKHLASLDYQQTVQKKYQRKEIVSAANFIPKAEAFNFFVKKGAGIYNTYCAACHGTDGGGLNGNPPIAGSEWVTGSILRLAMIPLHGVEGEIKVAGQIYNIAGGMAAIGKNLSDLELAGLLTYIRNGCQNSVGDMVSLDVIKEIRAVSSKRKGNTKLTAEELNNQYNKILKSKIKLNTLVDKRTGEPIEQ